MKKRLFYIITIVIILCIILFNIDFLRLQYFIVAGKIDCKLGHFDSAIESYQDALSQYPNNSELQELLDKTKLAVEFQTYLDDVRPILIEFKSINEKWTDLTVRETNRTVDDLSAAKELNEDLIPRLDKLVNRTSDFKYGDEFKNTNNDLVMSISLTRQALITSAQMLNSLHFSKQQNEQIQRSTSDAFFSNKRFFEAIDEKANELQVPMSGFWSSVN